MSNVEYPAIPNPAQSLASLQTSVERLKEGYELITGQRGSKEYSMKEGLTVLEKRVGGNTARMLELNEVVVNANMALAQRTTQLESEVTGARGGAVNLAARFTNVITAYTSADTALSQRADTLEAEVVNARTGEVSLLAKISQVQQARIDGDNALASSLTSVSTTVASHTATLVTHQNSINGNAVSFGVMGSIDGVTGGFIFEGVKSNGVGSSPVYTTTFNSNVVINGGLLVNGTVSTGKVVDNAITNSASVYAEQLASGSNLDVVLVTRAGARCVILVSVSNTYNSLHLSLTTGAFVTRDFPIFVDGNVEGYLRGMDTLAAVIHAGGASTVYTFYACVATSSAAFQKSGLSPGVSHTFSIGNNSPYPLGMSITVLECVK